MDVTSAPSQPSLLLSGRLEAISLPDVVQILCGARRTGLLVVEPDVGGTHVEIEIHEGRIVGARLVGGTAGLSAHARAVVERFMGADRATSVSGSAPVRSLEAVLREMESGQVAEFAKEVAARAESIVALAMSWDRGLFRFRRPRSGAAAPIGEPCVMLDPQELILGAARRWDETTTRRS